MLNNVLKLYKNLIDKKFHFILGSKGIEKCITITFRTQDLYHLLGIHKLKDLNSKAHKSIRKSIRNFELPPKSIDLIKKSSYFYSIVDRIELVSIIHELISDSKNHIYFHSNKNRTSFSEIDWDYLIRFKFNDRQGFYFFKSIDTEQKNELFCISTFYSDNNSYYKMQKEWKILKIDIEMRRLTSNLYTNPSFDRNK